VVTFSQLIVLVAGQTSDTVVLKWAMVRYSDMPRPASESPQVDHCSQDGGAAGATATATAAARAGAAVRPGPPFAARPLPGRAARLPWRWPVAAPASGRPPRVPLSRDWVPLPGRAAVPGLRAAIRARSARR